MLYLLLAAYPWLAADPGDSVASRVPPPAGFARVPVSNDSYAAFLRGLPLKAGHPDVLLYNGEARADQSAHLAVIDLDLSEKNLQQCADTVLRLRAEYLYSRQLPIAFHLTNGEALPWARYRDGFVATVPKKKIVWQKRSDLGASARVRFAEYLDTLFLYAGTRSLGYDMREQTTSPVEVGDVFLQAGSPGHVVVVVDVVVNQANERRFLLAQGYMPAQQAHVLLNPAHLDDPWYAVADKKLATPDWTFEPVRRWRFAD